MEQTQLALMSQLSFLPEEARLMHADTVAPETKNNSSSALTSHLARAWRVTTSPGRSSRIA